MQTMGGFREENILVCYLYFCVYFFDYHCCYHDSFPVVSMCFGHVKPVFLTDLTWKSEYCNCRHDRCNFDHNEFAVADMPPVH